MSTTNQNHKAVSDAFWRGDKSMLANGTLKCVCAEKRVQSFLTQGKVCNQTFGTNSNNLVQGDSGDVYVGKKLMLLVALAKLQKLVNWVHVVFNNLHSKLWDLSIAIKPKKKSMARRKNLVQPTC